MTEYTDPSLSDPPDFAARFRENQVELSFTGLPASLSAIMINTTVIVIAQWTVIQWQILVGWFTGMFGLSLYRYYTYRVYQARKSKEGSLKIWRKRAIAGTLASGAIWGSAAFLLVPLGEQSFHQTIIIASLIGMAAGGVITQAALLPASLGYMLLVIIPLIIRLFTLGGPANIGLGFMLCIYVIVMASGAISINRNLSESLAMNIRQRHSRKIIEHLAYHDALTNLPNRRLLTERLSKDIARSIHHSHIGALIYLDLDNFKTLNDSMGHQQGDELLKQLSLRLQSCLSEEDTATRLGGDEFVLLMPELADQESEALRLAELTIEKVQENLARPFLLGHREIHMSASIGIALFPLHGDNADDLLKRADFAMYRAKAIGRNTMSLYNPEMQEQAHLLMTLEQGLRNALRNNGLVIHYQPFVSIDGEVIGGEALVRWHHPQDGLVAPDSFIEHAEQSGLIIELGRQVLEQVCQHLNRLAESGLLTDQFKISINVSPLQFADRNFVSDIQATIDRYSIDAKHLLLEITENALLSDLGETISKLKQLREANFTLAIDDFGSGQSSLAYIKKLPIDLIKIDRILVKDITREKTDAVIVEGTIDMARKLGLKVVAEGVEEQSTFELLKRYACNIVQGDIIAKPMDLEGFIDFCQQQEINFADSSS
ncbi:MAG: EAL domain-containing protein [Candidatus Thiodiazotropha taylori]|nr:EAL domain-containing protein [Candidatus Thiodiazotropha taylori]